MSASTTLIDIEGCLAELSTPDKVALLSGSDMWHTHGIPHLAIPRVRVSDGPNGIRGISFFAGTAANCFPCATGLAASFDQDLLYTVGQQFGEECKSKGVHVWLGPTLNIQRSPLGGRGFESFSEDPVLSGYLSASIIKGVQSKGVTATPKHFVCNEQELDRNSNSSELSARALREVYLKPFQILLKESDPWALMTSYNRVNGTHVSENRSILEDILRREWGFDGMTMSDWFGTYSTVAALKAGLDLEMPGGPIWRGTVMERALLAGKLTEEDLNVSVRRILSIVNRAKASGIPAEKKEERLDDASTRSLLARTASEAVVLIKNSKDLLPLSKDSNIRKLAVIGSNASVACVSGGGSASMKNSYTVSPLNAITEMGKKEGMDVRYAMGMYSQRYLPLLDDLLSTQEGFKGMLLEWFLDDPFQKGSDAQVIHSKVVDTSYAFMLDNLPPALARTPYYLRLSATFTPNASGTWSLGLAIAGQAQLFVNDKLVISNNENQTPSDIFFGSGTVEERSTIELEKGRHYDMRMEFSNFKPVRPKANFGAFAGFRLGGMPSLEPESALQQAIHLVSGSDAAIVVVGLSADLESEGFDRPHMKLPQGTDDLILKVLKANPKTVIVVQSGTQCEMPWASQADTLLQAFYGGNETGAGIASVLFGKHNPSAKLPLSFPLSLRDFPSHPGFPGVDGYAYYTDDIFVGYRGLQAKSRPVLACFGHGLSYTTFDFSEPEVQPAAVNVSDRTVDVKVSVEVRNTGIRYAGGEVVQIYVSPPSGTPLPRAEKELAGFAKVHLPVGESKTVSLSLGRRSFSFWNPNTRQSGSDASGCWVVHPGKYGIHIATSLEDIKYSSEVEIREGFNWLGL